MRFILEHLEFSPVTEKTIIDFEVLVIYGMGWNFDLDEAAGFKVNLLPLGQTYYQFLDKGGDIVV